MLPKNLVILGTGSFYLITKFLEISSHNIGGEEEILLLFFRISNQSTSSTASELLCFVKSLGFGC